MSRASDIRAELNEVRAALSALTIQVNRLVERLDEQEFEVVNGDLVESSRPASATTASGAAGARAYTQAEREAAARETGAFFVRALSGEPRGSSGRGQIRLQNRIYVVIRSYAGEVHTDPVVVEQATPGLSAWCVTLLPRSSATASFVVSPVVGKLSLQLQLQATLGLSLIPGRRRGRRGHDRRRRGSGFPRYCA